MNLTVKSIKRTWMDVPFREVPRRNMIRELPHWTIFELYQVELECGVQGLQYWDDFMNGRRPVFAPGVKMEVVPDDGSGQWKQLYAEALKKPSWVMSQN